MFYTVTIVLARLEGVVPLLGIVDIEHHTHSYPGNQIKMIFSVHTNITLIRGKGIPVSIRLMVLELVCSHPKFLHHNAFATQVTSAPDQQLVQSHRICVIILVVHDQVLDKGPWREIVVS